eukprot:gene31781-6977_t
MSALRASAVGDWEVCGDFLYCREQLYDMSWEEVDLRSKRVCCAAYGGPIATVRDESKAVVITSSSSMRPLIRIFSAAGIELGSVLWERGRILDWGWSSNLELAVVEESAKVLVFSMHGEKLREFTLGAAVEREGVKEVCVHGEGMVVLTKSNRLWAVSNIQAPRVMAMAEVPGLATASGVESVPKCCLAVVDARATLSGSIEAFLPVGSTPTCPPAYGFHGVEVSLLACGSTVWQVDEETATDHRPLGSSASPSSSISMLSISPDGFFVALYTDDARLIVLSTGSVCRILETLEHARRMRQVCRDLKAYERLFRTIEGSLTKKVAELGEVKLREASLSKELEEAAAREASLTKEDLRAEAAQLQAFLLDAKASNVNGMLKVLESGAALRRSNEGVEEPVLYFAEVRAWLSVGLYVDLACPMARGLESEGLGLSIGSVLEFEAGRAVVIETEVREASLRRSCAEATYLESQSRRLLAEAREEQVGS